MSVRKIIRALLFLSIPVALNGDMVIGGKEVVRAVSKAPTITSELSVSFDYGKPFEYIITADNEPLGYSVRPLPVWMSRKGERLSGNAVKAGTYQLEIRALNAHGLGPVEKLTIQVNPHTPLTGVASTKNTQTP